MSPLSPGVSPATAMSVAVLVGVAAWLACPPGRALSWRPLVLLGPPVAGWVVVSGGLAARWLGLAVVLAGAAAGGRLVWRRHARRREREHTARGVLECCEAIAAELAAGQPPGAALAEAARRWPGLLPVVEAFELGSDVPSALRVAAAAPGAGELGTLASAWQVAHRSGHGLGRAVEGVARRIRARRRTQRVVTSELASARATSRVVALLPVVALGMGSGAGGDPWEFLLGTPAGWACLGAGTAFGVAGLWWIEAIADRVEQP